MKRLKVDFVSDVACPWCAIGLASFVEAVGRLQDQLEVELHFQPFELNRNMPPEGENLNEHIANKYGSNAAQIEENRRNLTAIAAESGLTFNLNRDSRIWNTFDAHRLMYWAEKVGNPLLLKQALPSLSGLEAVVIGRSELVGRPVAQLLLQADCTVTIAHSRTRDLPAVVRRADIVVAAVGRPRMVKGDWIKPGATVIDVGINRMPDGKLAGDVDYAEAVEVAGAITPVPGGVGPMTIACLLRNTLTAYRARWG